MCKSLISKVLENVCKSLIINAVFAITDSLLSFFMLLDATLDPKVATLDPKVATLDPKNRLTKALV